jgi:hypothetical protein
MADGPAKKFDVFLSHSHVDAEVIEQIAARLTDQAQLHVWLDKWEMVPGELFRQGLAKGLDEAACCAVFLGKTTPRGWFDQEIGRALNRQANDTSFRVIPVILPGGNRSVVDDFLELRSWVEFKNDIHDAEAFRLLKAGVLGVAPGRPAEVAAPVEAEAAEVRRQLEMIRSYRTDRLIDDQIAIEFQRKLMEQLMTRRGAP